MRTRVRKLPVTATAGLRLAVAASCLLGLAPCESRYAHAPLVRIQLSPETEYQTIDGIGGSAANERELRGMPEPSRSEVLDLVFGDLEPSVVRIKARPDMEPVNDDADPAHTETAAFIPPEDHLWQLDEIFARGTPRTLGALWSPPPWMKTTGTECCGGTLLPGMAPELAEFFGYYLATVEAAGHSVDWLSIQNEPEAAQVWDSNTYGPAEYAAVLETVAERIQSEEFATRLVAPDNAIASFTLLYAQLALAQPLAASLTDAVAFHHYQFGYYEPGAIAGSVGAIRAGIPAEFPLWMTEFSNTTGVGYGTWDEALAQAELIHETFAAGASMYVMWNLYRPGGPGEALVVIPTVAGQPEYTVTPKYWTLRQYTRFVKPGARRIGAESDDPDVLVTAYRDPLAATLTTVFVNRADTGRWVWLDGASLSDAPVIERSSESELGIALPPESDDRLGPQALRLPARSVTTAVWPDPSAPGS